MKITDEMLSAFLDAELPEPEMQMIREALHQDEQLSERLAALAEVDVLLKQHASQMDLKVVPEQLMALLDEPRQDNLISFPLWRRITALQPWSGAAAACLAVVAGYSLALWQAEDPWTQISLALETQAAGTDYPLSSDATLTAHLTFLDKQGRYCRQYQVSSQTQVSQQLACRSAQGWILEVMVNGTAQDKSGYQTATGSQLLDPMIDQMISGQVVSLSAEQELIRQQWVTTPNGEQP
jgi:hypothetical protein